MSQNPMIIQSPSGTRTDTANPPALAACTTDLEVRNSRSNRINTIGTTVTTTTLNNQPRNNQNVLSMKSKSMIGVWNVRSLIGPGKLEQLSRELSKFKLDMIGISECRWKDSGEINLSNGTKFLYSGRSDTHHNGVGFLLSKTAVRALLQWQPINDRFIWCRFRSRARNVTIIQTYAPTELAEPDEKLAYYNQLSSIIHNAHKRDILIVMSDLNVKIGADNTNIEHILGKHGLETRNENGELLIEACNDANLVIGGSIFPHKACHKSTSVSPDGQTENQIDHICIGKMWRSSLLDVRIKRSADIGLDHQLLVATLRLKICTAGQRRTLNSLPKLDISKLNSEDVKNTFVSKLSTSIEQLQSPEVSGNTEQIWQTIKSAFLTNAEDVLGLRPRNRKPWMSESTWSLIECRRAAKITRDNAKTRALKAETNPPTMRW
ncbi:craniofacial development protein 2-like [Teleopsis dalmanni]|uniref:craniofacial development protein 2-like n=1 Tax=Teleopsis dalmanni TaxID=139649 RepID=UPI0018CDAE15|nr:craniofacial development protein 2-like [Teleopsis dalmanni]